MEEIIESGRRSKQVIIPIAQRVTKTLKFYMTTYQALGVNKKDIDLDLHAALVGNDPTKQWFYEIFTQSMIDNSEVKVSMQVTLTYYAKFFQRKTLSQS